MLRRPSSQLHSKIHVRASVNNWNLIRCLGKFVCGVDECIQIAHSSYGSMIGPLLKQEIENSFAVMPGKGSTDELVFLCPECGDRSGHRAVNLKTGKTFCWRCGKGKNNKGHFLAWAKALGYTFANDEGYSSVPVDQLLNEDDKASSVIPVIQQVDLPRGFTTLARRPKSVYTRYITKMAERKHLLYEDFVEAGVGFTMDDPRWEAYAIFPVYDYGTCVYYQGRTYVDVPDQPTKRFPSRNMVAWGAGYWVYNIDAVRAASPKTVVIVESILNVLSLRWKLRELGRNDVVPVCVFKHHISQVQVLKLLRCKGVKEFCLLFDHDAIEKTWHSVGYLSNKVKVTVAEMPLVAGNRKCDPNDDVEAAIRAIDKRKLYTMSSADHSALEGGPSLDITGRDIKSSS